MASSSPPPPASAPSTSKAAESLRSLRCAGDSTSTSTDTARAIPGSWRDTLASTWGYPVAATPAAPAGSLALPAPRSKQLRGGIPFFNSEDPDDESEQRRAESTAVLAIVDASLEGGLVENKSEEQLERERRLDKLCAGIMYKAPPSPSHTSTLLIIAPCNLPPPPSPPSSDDEDERPLELPFTQQEVMEGLKERLERFSSETGQEGYSVVLLTAPTPHPPPTALLVSTYLALSRESRKKVNRVWIVGKVGWWMSVLLTLFLSTLLSRKTAEKISQVPSLSDLAKEEELGREGFRRLEIPLEVYTANAAVETEIVLSPPDNEEKQFKVFGVELDQLMGKNGEKGLPRLVGDCLEVLCDKGPESLGVFRRSPSAANVKVLQGVYDRGQPICLPSLPDAPYLAASLLKSFFRELLTPIFPPSFYPLARACPLPTNAACVQYTQEEILPQLSSAQLVLLAALCETLHTIANNAEINLMDVNNLAVVLTPNLIGGLGASEVELEMCRVPGMEVGTMRGVRRKEREVEGGNSLAGVVKGCLVRYREIFTHDLLNTLAPHALRPPSLSSASTPSPALAAPSSPHSLPPKRSPSPPTSRRSFSPSSSPTSSRRPSLASLYEEEPASRVPSTPVSLTDTSKSIKPEIGVEGDESAGVSGAIAELSKSSKSRRLSSSSLTSSTSSKASRSSSSRSLSLLDTAGGSTIKAKGMTKGSSTVGKSASLTQLKGGNGTGREDVRGIFALSEEAARI